MAIAIALRRARKAIPIRGWERVFRYVFNPDEQTPFEFERPLYEGIYISDASRFIDWSALLYGAYEQHDVEAMRSLLLTIRNPIVLDVGANTGHHAIAIGALARQVHAFEPYPPVRAVLERNVARNKHMAIIVHPIALSSQNSRLRFCPPTTNNAGTGSLSPTGSIEVLGRTGDKYLAEVGIAEVDMIKIDVEGHELEVLRGLKDTIRHCEPILIVEATTGVASLEEFLPSEYRYFVASRRRLITPPNVFCVPSSRACCIGNTQLHEQTLGLK
jgi:FkbM family methyltransferase